MVATADRVIEAFAALGALDLPLVELPGQHTWAPAPGGSFWTIKRETRFEVPGGLSLSEHCICCMHALGIPALLSPCIA